MVLDGPHERIGRDPCAQLCSPSLAQDVKGLWNLDLERPAAPKPAVRAAPAGGSEDLLVADVEELDIDDELGQVRSTASRSRGGVQEAASRPISMAEAGALKKLVFGNGKLTFNSAWTQGVFPSSTEGLSYGIVQREGGPCGVLATVQAFLLRHLLFMDDSLASSRPPALCSRKVPCDPAVVGETAVRLLAARCDGFSGADLQALLPVRPGARPRPPWGRGRAGKQEKGSG